jgi:4-hydroxy-3-methylbut-2-enyl diphosphate reductase
MQIILAKNIGFCAGLKRALLLAEESIKEKPKPCQVLGSLLHNEEVVAKLKKRGVKFIKSPKNAKRGILIISAHGPGREDLSKISKKIKIVDATCLLVKKAQNLAKYPWRRGQKIVIIGDKNHSEVESIQSAINNEGIVVEEEREARQIKLNKKSSIAVVAQTTQSPDRVEKILNILKRKYKKVDFYNTLCPFVLARQREAKEIAKKADVMLVVGSKTSANTRRLAETSKEFQKNTYHIENSGQLDKVWISKAKKVGIVAGTSTPEWIIKGVIKRLKVYTP